MKNDKDKLELDTTARTQLESALASIVEQYPDKINLVIPHVVPQITGDEEYLPLPVVVPKVSKEKLETPAKAGVVKGKQELLQLLQEMTQKHTGGTSIPKTD